MIPDRIKKRLNKDRPMTSITLRIQQDVVDDLKEMAPLLGFSGYQALLKAYVSEGMRRDEAKLFFNSGRGIADPSEARSSGAGDVATAVRELDQAIRYAEEARRRLRES